MFLQLLCFLLMIENLATTFFCWVDLFQSVKAGKELLFVDWETRVTSK